jgi:hypothetical protein
MAEFSSHMTQKGVPKMYLCRKNVEAVIRPEFFLLFAEETSND